jgi:hydroxymethylglutaryl-CoA lyase
MVHMLELCGVDTGVDLDRLIDIARDLPGVVGHDVPGQLIKSGKRDRRYAVPQLPAIA